MKILVDTDVIIDLIRLNEKDKTLFNQVFQNVDNSAVISFTTVIELYAGQGTRKTEERDFIERIIGETEVINGAMDIYRKSGEYIRDHKMSFPDALIAATAAIYKLPLLTRNEKHFKHIQGVEIMHFDKKHE